MHSFRLQLHLNIKYGFRATGIFPYNPEIFGDSFYVFQEFIEENRVAVLRDNELSEGQQNRILFRIPRDVGRVVIE